MALPKGTRIGPYEIVGQIGADGSPFLTMKRANESDSQPRIVVVLSWFEALERLVPAN